MNVHVLATVLIAASVVAASEVEWQLLTPNVPAGNIVYITALPKSDAWLVVNEQKMYGNYEFYTTNDFNNYTYVYNYSIATVSFTECRACGLVMVDFDNHKILVSKDGVNFDANEIYTPGNGLTEIDSNSTSILHLEVYTQSVHVSNDCGLTWLQMPYNAPQPKGLQIFSLNEKFYAFLITQPTLYVLNDAGQFVIAEWEAYLLSALEGGSWPTSCGTTCVAVQELNNIITYSKDNGASWTNVTLPSTQYGITLFQCNNAGTCYLTSGDLLSQYLQVAYSIDLHSGQAIKLGALVQPGLQGGYQYAKLSIITADGAVFYGYGGLITQAKGSQLYQRRMIVPVYNGELYYYHNNFLLIDSISVHQNNWLYNGTGWSNFTTPIPLNFVNSMSSALCSSIPPAERPSPLPASGVCTIVTYNSPLGYARVFGELDTYRTFDESSAWSWASILQIDAVNQHYIASAQVWSDPYPWMKYNQVLFVHDLSSGSYDTCVNLTAAPLAFASSSNFTVVVTTPAPLWFSGKGCDNAAIQVSESTNLAACSPNECLLASTTTGSVFVVNSNGKVTGKGVISSLQGHQGGSLYYDLHAGIYVVIPMNWNGNAATFSVSADGLTWTTYSTEAADTNLASFLGPPSIVFIANADSMLSVYAATGGSETMIFVAVAVIPKPTVA